MKFLRWSVLLLVLLAACQSARLPVHVVDGDAISTLHTSERVPSILLEMAGIALGPDDRVLYLGEAIPPDTALPEAEAYTLVVRRAVQITIQSPGETRQLFTSAQTVGEALTEAGYELHVSDRIAPPAGTPILGDLTVDYQPARQLIVTVDGQEIAILSGAESIGMALAAAGLSLQGLDYSLPPEAEALPADGRIRIVRVVEPVSLSLKDLPYETRTELSADLEIDQQALLQSGEPGLAAARTRTRLEDGVQVSLRVEDETIIRPPQDRLLGIGSKIVIRTAVVDGQTIEYWRALRLFATSYSPCQSASPDGRCLYGTSSGLPVQRGTVAMVYSWYLAFGFERLYIPGYGYATVGDVGGGCPPAAAEVGCPAGSHTWVDLAWTDEEFQPMAGWMTVYFLTPVPANPFYILP